MKKTVLLICLMLSASSLSYVEAQNPFKPLSEFQKDTIAYLEYNYGGCNTEVLKGKTIGEFLNESDVEYTTFNLVAFKKNREARIELYLQSYEYVTYREDRREMCGVLLELLIDDWPDFFDTFNKRKFIPLTRENKDLLENIIISENGCLISIRVIENDEFLSKQSEDLKK